MAKSPQRSIVFFGQLLSQSADTGSLVVSLDERGVVRDSEVQKLLGAVYRKEAGFFIFLPTMSYAVPEVPFGALEEIINSPSPTPKRSWSKVLRAHIWNLYQKSPILQEQYPTEPEFYEAKMAELVAGIRLEVKMDEI